MESLKIRNQTLAFGSRTFVMAILNVTPDSFSGDGILAVDKAVAQALEQIRLGADLIDIGGQSTRPGHVPISEEEEAQRILPVIEKLRSHTDTIISIDTYSPAVLQAALSAGGDLLNSIWGLEKGLLGALGGHKCPVVIMHNKTVAEYGASSSSSSSASSSSSSSASPVAAEVCAYLKSAAQDALACGLLPAQIILDPGIGFGKTADHNLEMLANLKQLTALGFPTLLGSSRKSTIGKLTGKAAHERIFGTAATVALGIESGIDIVRVHDVAEILDVVKVSDAIVRGWRPVGWGV